MTSNGMAHEEAREALEALALDALSVPERAAVLAHVDGCAACRHELAALEVTAAELSYAVRPEPMSDAQRDRVRGRLMNRIAAERGDAERVAPQRGALPPVVMPVASRRPTPEAVAAIDAHGTNPFHVLIPRTPNEGLHHPTVFTAARAWWLALAACLVTGVSLATLYQVTKERDAISAAYQLVAGDRSTGHGTVDSLRSALLDRDKLIANLTGPQVAVMSLASTSPTSPSARMFWDQSVDAWTFVAHNMPKPRTGRTYQLWLVTADKKINAGTFTPGANGDAVVRATYALPKDALAAVAVTDEPEAGSPQPTTVPMLVATKSTR
jgi:anti-sigma-K factor RskA